MTTTNSIARSAPYESVGLSDRALHVRLEGRVYSKCGASVAYACRGLKRVHFVFE